MNGLWEMGCKDLRVPSNHESAFKNVAQFSYVARPIVLLKHAHDISMDMDSRCSVCRVQVSKDCIAKLREIFFALAQRRQMNFQNAQAHSGCRKTKSLRAWNTGRLSSHQVK